MMKGIVYKCFEVISFMVREWILKIFPKEFRQIRAGLRTIEGRAPLNSNPGKTFSEMKPGDLITFRAVSKENKKILRGESITFEILFNHCYKEDSPKKAIYEMLSKEGFKNVLPDCESIEEGVRVYMDFPDYPKRISKWGIHAIGLGKKVR